MNPKYASQSAVVRCIRRIVDEEANNTTGVRTVMVRTSQIDGLAGILWKPVRTMALANSD
jgi:hypothetical protein